MIVVASRSGDGLAALGALTTTQLWASLLFAGLSTASAAMTWSVLMSGVGRPFSEFVLIQGTKYLPLGGALQGIGLVAAAGQLGMSRRDGVERFLTMAIVHALAGLGLGVIMFRGPIPAAIGFIAVFTLMVLLLMGAARVRGVHGAFGGEVKPLVITSVTALLSVGAAGMSFSALMPGNGRSIADTVSQFAVAWTAGFLALPLPSGVVAREAVLVSLGLGTVGQIAAVSLMQRTIAVIGDLLLAGSVIVARVFRR